MIVARSVLASGLAVSGCSSPSRVEWSIDFGSDAEGFATSFVQARIRRDACETGPIVRDFGDVGRTGSVSMPQTQLAPGRYCFEADAIDRSCVRFAAARIPVELPSSAPISLLLAPVQPDRLCAQRVCVEGVCQQIDAGVDAGLDASWPDASLPDIGLVVPDAYLPRVPSSATGCKPATVLTASAGGAHTCAITTSNELYCWGDDAVGQLGVGGRGEARLPVLVGRGYTQVRAGGAHTCALDTSRSLWCWGRNDHGQLGDGTTTDRSRPVHVLDEIDAFTTGFEHTCAGRGYFDPMTSTYSFQAYCWGSNEHGQLGLAGPDQHTPALLAVGPLYGLEAGGTHTCAHAIDDMGAAILCWGEAGPWLGHDGGGPTPARAAIEVSAFPALSLGRHVSCVALPTADLTRSIAACWGQGAEGRLLDGTTRDSSSPSMGTTASGVAAGGSITCQVDPSLGVSCAGPASTGIRGPTPSGGSWPDLVLPLRHTVIAGDRHACGHGADGVLACWGANEHGQLGSGVTSDVEPTPHSVCF